MSRSQRKAKKGSLGVYPTPSWVVDRLLETISLPSGRWLEPAVGYGHICRAVDAWRAAHQLPTVDWVTNDILATEYAATNYDVVVDYPYDHYDVVITNPPFSRAEVFFERFYPMTGTLVLLLPISWLGTAYRAALHRRYAPTLHVLPERPRFRGGANTDQETYAWWVWKTHDIEHRYNILSDTPVETRRQSEQQAWAQMPNQVRGEQIMWIKPKKAEKFQVPVIGVGIDVVLNRPVAAVSDEAVRVVIQSGYVVTLSLVNGRQIAPRQGMQCYIPDQSLLTVCRDCHQFLSQASNT